MNDRSKWSVSVLSSSGFDGDFLPIRGAVIESLWNWGFSPVAYELDTFPDNCASVTSNCLQNLAGVDIVLLFITNRYGHFDVNFEDQKLSVTRCEYYRACGIDLTTKEQKNKTKIVIKFVDKKIHLAYKHYMNLSDEEKAPYIKQLKADINSDHPELIFDFIYEIYNNVGKSGSVLHEFDSNDITSTLLLVKSLLHNQARNIYMNYILPKQKSDVDNFRGGIGSLLSTREIVNNQYYVNPQTDNPELHSDDLLDEHVILSLSKGKSLYIYGEAGTGKSTVLTKAFGDHCTNVLENIEETTKYPLFISLSGRSIPNINDLITYPDEVLKNIGKEKYPFDLWRSAELGEGFVYYCDAFDESFDAKNGHGSEALETLCSQTCVITSRPADYYSLSLVNSMSHFFEIIKITGWDSTCLSAYIEKRYSEYPKEVKDKLIKCLSPSGVVYTPLITTIYLSYIDNEKILGCDSLPKFNKLVVGQVFDNAVKSFLHREARESNKHEDDVLLKEKILCCMGWLINYQRQERIDSYSSEQLLDELSKELPDISREYLEKTVGTFIDLHIKTAIHPVHDLFIDFFTAKYMYTQLLCQPDISNDIFSKYPSSDGNRMLRDLVKVDTADNQLKIVKYLCGMYSKTCNTNQRIIIMYLIPGMISRDSSKSIKGIITSFCKKEFVKGILFKRKAELVPLLNWMAQIGKVSQERIYYNMINNDSKFAAMNRSCYLRYLRQSGNKNPFDYDDRKVRQKGSWDYVVRGLAEHFQANEVRHCCIRRVDITIARNFLENGYSVYADGNNDKIIFCDGKAYSILEFYIAQKSSICEKTFNDEYRKRFADYKEEEKAKKELLDELDRLITVIKNRIEEIKH